MYIYICENQFNKKKYIGKTTTNVKQRWKRHVEEAFNSNLIGYKFIFHKALRKYGLDLFKFFQIDSFPDLTNNELLEIEKSYIDYYRTYVGFNDCWGYNMTLGGEGGLIYGKQINVYDMSLNYITSYSSIEEAARNLNVYSTNISAIINQRGRAKTASNYVFSLNEEEPVFPYNNNKRKIDIYNESGKFIRTLDSIKETSEYLNVSMASVFDCCNRKQLTTNKHICSYSGESITDRTKSNNGRVVKVYDLINEELIGTFSTIKETMTYLDCSKNPIQRAIKQGSNTFKNYLIYPG